MTGFMVAFLAGISMGGSSFAQTGEPPLPESIEGLVSKGAQVKYLGKISGLDGWIMIYRGQEQYFYVTEDGSAFVSGLLFSADGEPLTVRQVERLQKSGEAQILDNLLSREDDREIGSVVANQQKELERLKKSPAEQLYQDVSEANWVTFGQPGAPVVYAFIDPTCSHCHDFIDEMRGEALENGAVELRVLPVSRFPDSKENMQKAAFMLASPQPEKDFYAHMEGKEDALPGQGDLNTQAVQQNLAVIQKWQLDAIPFIIYRSKSGDVKIIRGKVRSPSVLLSDLG